MNNWKILIGAACVALPTASFGASVTTITVGDDDCFGRNESPCGDGTEIVAPTPGFDANGVLPFPTDDRSSALDPAGTDVFGELGPLSFAFGIDMTGQTVTDITLSAKVWGLDLFATSGANGGAFGDAFEGARFQFNGVDVGTYFAPPGAGPNLVEIPTFDVAPGVLINGTNTIDILPEDDFIQFAGAFFTGLDAFAVDFVSVSVTHDAVVVPPVVPLPAGLPLMLGGLAAFGLVRARKTG